MNRDLAGLAWVPPFKKERKDRGWVIGTAKNCRRFEAVWKNGS
ncbi:hypothetical protein B4135_0445 [Caldibacillus debilis]|uniref:Uncharacterized protein n=1 Tax=Caldibacillus debilis TaxID=301148 RepID=A0A150L8T4_9BACI|nr:hypothetical protein B4135_0445 [Caldibacillus debilis]